MSEVRPIDAMTQDLTDIVRQTWLILDDPSLAEKDHFCEILENGAIVSVRTAFDQIIDCETITEPAGWVIPDLPPAPMYRNTNNLGGITVDLEDAMKLRDLTTSIFERFHENG